MSRNISAALNGLLVRIPGSTIQNELPRVRTCTALDGFLGRATIIYVVGLFSSTASAQIERGSFGDARPLMGLSGPYRDEAPYVSPNGLEIYFSSDRSRPGMANDFTAFDIWMASRNSTSELFGEPVKLGPTINTDTLGEETPDLSQDMLSLYYFSGSGPGAGDGDIWVSERESLSDPWKEPMSLGPNINRPNHEDISPTISNDGLTLVFSSQSRFGGVEAMDLFLATRTQPTEQFGDPIPLDNINTDDFGELFPDISSNGLALFYHSTDAPFGFPAIWVATRPSLTDEFDDPININDLGKGSQINTSSAVEISPGISDDWPAPGSKLYYSRAFTGTDWDIWEATWHVDRFSDVNLDGVEDDRDIDLLSQKTGESSIDSLFDLNLDGLVDAEDRRIWVEERANTYFGDSNLDGKFDSLDLVAVLQADQFLDSVVGNSTWATGDWNGDGDFDQGDIVVALQGGGYQQGLRALHTGSQPVLSVPEPSALVLIAAGVCLAALTMGRVHKRQLY